MLRALPLLLLGLATPTLAQQLGAVEGEGTQTQSLGLLQDTVSVTLESSGAFSLGRGEPSVGGGFGLSVNDTTIIGVGEKNRQGTATTETGRQPKGQSGQAGASTSAADPVSGLASSGSNSTSVASGECPSDNMSADQLSNMLQPGQQIWLRPMDCPALASSSELVAAFPQISGAISSAGMAPEDVVAITFADDVVIVGMRSGS